MITIRWIAGIIVYYGLIHIGILIYIPIISKIPLWKWIVPNIIVNALFVYAVALVSYFAALIVIYMGRAVPIFRMHKLITPLGVINTWFFAYATYNKVFTGMPWKNYAGITINFIMWLLALSTCVILTNKLNGILYRKLMS